MNSYATAGVSALVGAAFGAAAIQALHAQARKPPPGFAIAEITIKNQDGYEKQFLPAIVGSIGEKQGNSIVWGGSGEALLGPPPRERVSVTQYENLDRAREWWNSQVTKNAVKIGQQYADIRVFIVEGASLPSP